MASSLALAPGGGFYASGRLNTEPYIPIDFGDGVARDGGAYLLKLDDAGELQWVRTVNDDPMGPAVGGYIAVNQVGNVVWANQDLHSLNVRTFSASGDLLWRRPIEVVPTETQPNQLPGWGLFGFAMYPDGRVVLGASCEGTIDYGDGPQACPHGFATLTPSRPRLLGRPRRGLHALRMRGQSPIPERPPLRPAGRSRQALSRGSRSTRATPAPNRR